MLSTSASLDHASAFVGFMMLIAILYGWQAYKAFISILKPLVKMPILGTISFWLVATAVQALLFAPFYWLVADIYNGLGSYSDYTEFLGRFTLLCSTTTMIGYFGHTVYALFSHVDLEKSISMQDGFNAAVKETEGKIKFK